MKQMKTISKTVDQYNGAWPPEDAAGALAWFQAKLTDVPPEFRGTARIEIGSEESDGSSKATIEVSYTRPETDDEEVEREGQIAARAESRRAEELRTLAALQTKYGKPA